MNTSLVRSSLGLTETTPRTPEAMMIEIVNLRRQLGAVDAGSTILSRLDQTRRRLELLLDLLSEHARVALLDVSNSGEDAYLNALPIVAQKMSDVHVRGRDLFKTVNERAKQSFTDVEHSRFITDLGLSLRALSFAVRPVIEVREEGKNTPIVDRLVRFDFGTSRTTQKESVSDTLLQRFMGAFGRNEIDNLLLYVMPVDDATLRDKAVQAVVNRVIAKMRGVDVSADEKAGFVKAIADFMTSIRTGKNPYIRKAGEVVIAGTLPEIIDFQPGKKLMENIREWMKARAQKNGTKKNGSANGGLPPLMYPELSEKSAKFIEGVLLLYWNNGFVDEQVMSDQESIKALQQEIVLMEKNHPGIQCVGAYFHDKHMLEETLLFLPRGAQVQMKLRGTDKVCSIIRSDDGSLVIDDLFGNPPPLLMGVSQEDILANPFEYFSAKGIALDTK